MEQQQQLQHFSHPEHPLVFNQFVRRGYPCWGCREEVYGPSYSCKEPECPSYRHHKSCTELPLGLHHPLHPIHPLILFDPWRWAQAVLGEDKQIYKCELCKEYKDVYTYRCSRCDFNLHITCASIPLIMEAEFHDHPLTPIWKSFTFTCDICGKEGKGVPNLCATCCFWIHRSYDSLPRRLKVVHHKHLLHITHSSLELRESDSRFCLLCVQKVDTCYGLYYCSKYDFVSHLNCVID